MNNYNEPNINQNQNQNQNYINNLSMDSKFEYMANQIDNISIKIINIYIKLYDY